MSVHASQKTTTSLQVKDTAIQLYRDSARLVYDKDIVPQPLNSEFRYPVTANLRDMCTNIAIALQCDTKHDFKRREEKLMAAHDCTVIHDTYMEMLARSRDIPDDQMTNILRMNVTVSRLIKTIMADDRNQADHNLKSVPKKDKSAADELFSGKDSEKESSDDKPKPTGKANLFDENDTRRLSINDLRRKALAEAPEFAGIVNDPTDPTSPVIDKVKETQRIRSSLSSLATGKSRKNRKSSK